MAVYAVKAQRTAMTESYPIRSGLMPLRVTMSDTASISATIKMGYKERDEPMETIKLTTRIDNTGTLHLALPTNMANQEVEVLVVLHPANTQGWPVGYFEALDAIEADDLTERPDQGVFEEREPLE
jgi:hypothetical protein